MKTILSILLLLACCSAHAELHPGQPREDALSNRPPSRCDCFGALCGRRVAALLRAFDWSSPGDRHRCGNAVSERRDPPRRQWAGLRKLARDLVLTKLGSRRVRAPNGARTPGDCGRQAGRGTLNGVYTLLEEKFGIRWFTPELEVVPKDGRAHAALLRREARACFGESGRVLARMMRDPNFRSQDAAQWPALRPERAARRRVHHLLPVRPQL